MSNFYFSCSLHLRAARRLCSLAAVITAVMLNEAGGCRLSGHTWTNCQIIDLVLDFIFHASPFQLNVGLGFVFFLHCPRHADMIVCLLLIRTRHDQFPVVSPLWRKLIRNLSAVRRWRRKVRPPSAPARRIDPVHQSSIRIAPG